MSIFDDIRDIFRNNNLEISDGLMGAVESISGDCEDQGTGRRAPINGSRWGMAGQINLIPSDTKGMCHSELIVLCYDKDKFDQRLRDMLYCAGIICRDVNRVAVFITSRWDPSEYIIHRDAVDALRGNGIKVIFILVSSAGASDLKV